jgi:penicillin-binding protein 2
VPGRDWKRANYDTGWRSGETVITGIGQGYLLTTPLQLAVMTAALANGGKLVTPTLLNTQDAPPQAPRIGVTPENLAVIRQGMYRAVNKPEGTAYASSLLIDGQRMSGKTGTVQVRRISMVEREEGVIPNSELDWHLRDHALFVGYVPHDAPRYAISVVIEHGGGGGQVAAPMARDIMVQLLRSQASPQAASSAPSQERS